MHNDKNLQEWGSVYCDVLVKWVMQLTSPTFHLPMLVFQFLTAHDTPTDDVTVWKENPATFWFGFGNLNCWRETPTSTLGPKDIDYFFSTNENPLKKLFGNRV